MLEKAALVMGGLGVGYSLMYFGMHRAGAPFQERGIVAQPDVTPTSTYALIGVASVAAGLAAAHVYNTSR